VVSLTSSEVQSAAGISRNDLKSLTNAGLIRASIAEGDGTGHYRRFSLVDLTQVGFAVQVKQLGVARPKLVAAWLGAVPKALKTRARFMICRADRTVRLADKLDGLKKGEVNALVVNLQALQHDLLERLGRLGSEPAEWG